MEKFKVTDITKEWDGRTLRRIQAVRDFGFVHAGDLGGWIQNDFNLDQNGNCWIYGDAIVCDHALVRDHAHVSQDAIVKDHAEVCGYAQVLDYAIVCDGALLRDDTQVYNHALICGNAIMEGNSSAWDNAVIGGLVIIRGDAHISQDGFITSQSDVYWSGPFGLFNDTLTAHRCRDGRVYIFSNTDGWYFDEYKQYINSIESSNKKLYKAILDFVKVYFRL